MILLHKGTVIQRHVTEAKVAVLWGKIRAFWLIYTNTFQWSLPSPILKKRPEGEIVREHYDAAMFRASITPCVFTGTHWLGK
jgi:hypothetical protein